jgi:transglutaminase-like putative cysteine protease
MVTRARRVAPFALAALSAAAALSLGRLLASGRFVVPVLVAVALAHGVGALARWRSAPWWATALVEVLTLALYAQLAFGSYFDVLGVELGGSSLSLAEQLDAGWTLVRTAPPPAPVTDGALLLAVIASYLVAAIGDWLAFRREAVLAAMAPALVLFVWATTLGTTEYRERYVLGFAAAAGAFLVVQNLAVLDRGRSWLVSQQPQRRRWLMPAAALTIGAIAVGMLLAPVIPGAGADPILDIANTGRDRSGGSSYRTGIAPLVDVSAKLNEVAERQLFTVTAARPEYWRVAALDRFTPDGGGQWTLQAEGDEVSVGLPSARTDGALHQEYVIGPMGERWLPAAYRPVAISLDDTLVVASSSTLVADQDSVEGLRYSVDSVVPPSAADVSADVIAATAAPIPRRLTPFTEVPPGLAPIIASSARQVVDGAGSTTPYGQAAALRDFFRSGEFVYDTSIDPVDTPDAVAAFLQDRRGFCVQFATAYAVMARTLGIPTRIAVGFTPGEFRDGTYHVTTHDAHAWPEVWLRGIGWTNMFDPTPPAPGVASGGSDLAQEPAIAPAVTLPAQSAPTTPTGPPITQPGGGTTPTAPTDATTAPTGGSTPPATAAAPLVTTESPDGSSSPWFVVIALLLLVVVAFGAYVAIVLTTKTRRRSARRDAPPTESVVGAWEEALDELRAAHVDTDAALTPLELGRTIPAGVPGASRPLRELARTYTAARYGASGATPDDAERAWASMDELSAALDGDLSPRERWRRRLDPTTLRTARRPSERSGR